ncbi:MAG: histidinol dehydrogenase [Coriobacteriia bacterium]|nr:histidinol dehydrogenase [Coriobacteriia bacterium]
MLMRRITLQAGQQLTKDVLARSGGIDESIERTAGEIIADVLARGDEALRDYTSRFDGAQLADFRVTEAEMEACIKSADPALVDALSNCANRIVDFHERQVQQSWFATPRKGVMVGQQVTPLDRVGIYVPGGRADYPSTVLMNVIPALVAGVPEIAVVVPPQADGSLVDSTMLACYVAGVDEIYKVGGAQAIAALAYGTASIPAVDKITGPGNAYVAAAKMLVQGTVGIDMVAGPSEVLVLADETANPAYVAIDLMAQAEHDPLAACYLVTTDASLPDKVEAQLATLLAQSSRADITRASLADNGVVILCDTLDDALAASNYIAPEHLEVLTADPQSLLSEISNAGAIFLGPWTPEAVGDYSAGPNHTLPTQGTARFYSPLGVDDFVKTSSVLSYSADALLAEADDVTLLADTEQLWAHAQSVRMRVAQLREDQGKEADQSE